MTLENQALEKLNSWRPEGAGRHSLAFSTDGWAVHLTADRNDSLACLAWELSLASVGEPPARTLKAWAAAIEQNTSGLMEDLRVLEIDADRDEAQLRSDAPTRRGPIAAYFEVTLHGPEKAVLRRYEADTARGAKRQQVPFAMTHELLAKLISDLVR
jgi:hypothetical protein